MAVPEHEAACPICGGAVTELRMHNEQSLVAPETGEVRGAQRMFQGNCAEHGKVFALVKMGHHSTLGSAAIERRYPRPADRLIRDQLTGSERKAYILTRKGWRRPLKGDLRKWDLMSIAARLNSTASRLGQVVFRPSLVASQDGEASDGAADPPEDQS